VAVIAKSNAAKLGTWILESSITSALSGSTSPNSLEILGSQSGEPRPAAGDTARTSGVATFESSSGLGCCRKGTRPMNPQDAVAEFKGTVPTGAGWRLRFW
jgi:hypothetical protein